MPPPPGSSRRRTPIFVVIGVVFALCMCCQVALVRNIFSAVSDVQQESPRALLRAEASDTGEAATETANALTSQAHAANHTKNDPPPLGNSDLAPPLSTEANTQPPATSTLVPSATSGGSSQPWTAADVAFDRVFNADTTGFTSKFAAASRGIVMCMHTAIVPMGVSLIQELRALGNSDPIQVYHCLSNELSSSALKALNGLDSDVEVVDLCSVLVSSGVFGDQGVAHRFQNFWLKPLAVVFTHFTSVMLLDVDNIFLHDPALLWSSTPFRDTGTLFFYDRVLDFSQFLNQDVGPDRTYIQEFFDTFPYDAVNLKRPPVSDTMQRSMVWNKHTAHEQDSSVVVIDKLRAGPHVLRTMWYLATTKRFQDQFAFSWGDKEAFWLAFELANVQYAFSPWNCGVVSLPDDITLHPTTLCGSLAQYWPELDKNDLFFVNGNAVVNLYHAGDGRHTNWAARADELIAAIPKHVTPRHTRHTTSQDRQGLDQTCLIGEGAEAIADAFHGVAERRIRQGQAAAEAMSWD